jgi:hypothetical protein
LDPILVAELSRVRTDLDALDPVVLDLLIAQGYFLTDFFIKLTMPDLVFPVRDLREWYTDDLAPAWESAHESVAAANTNRSAVTAHLARESRRVGLLGSVPRARERWLYRIVFALVASPLVIVALALLAMLAVGARTLVEWVVR